MDESKNRPRHQTEDKYFVRFPDGMRGKIAEAAKANKRSINAEIIARLDASFDEAVVSPSIKGVQNKLTYFFAQQKRALDARAEQIELLEKYFRRAVNALSMAVGLVQSKVAAPSAIAQLHNELSGLQYFLGVVDEKLPFDEFHEAVDQLNGKPALPYRQRVKAREGNPEEGEQVQDDNLGQRTDP